MKYELHIRHGLSELDKDEWISFWRRYNLIQFWNGNHEETAMASLSPVINRDEIKELYPGMEDIVDILIDNNIPFSYDGVFELTNDDNEVIASASMIIDNPKIAIDPFSEDDKAVFEQNGFNAKRIFLLTYYKSLFLVIFVYRYLFISLNFAYFVNYETVFIRNVL